MINHQCFFKVERIKPTSHNDGDGVAVKSNSETEQDPIEQKVDDSAEVWTNSDVVQPQPPLSHKDLFVDDDVENFQHFTHLTGDKTCALPWSVNNIPFCCATKFFHYRPFCTYIRATGHLPPHHHHMVTHHHHHPRIHHSPQPMQMGGWIG